MTKKTTNKRTTSKRSLKRPDDIKSIRRKVSKYKGNLIGGLKQIFELDEDIQHFILFNLTVNDTLYNQHTNSHINKYFLALEHDEDFRKSIKEDNDMYPCNSNSSSNYPELWDFQTSPMIRGKILSGLQELITGGGRKKWEKVLREISNTFHEGKFQ
jgi:hypothetical protein